MIWTASHAFYPDYVMRIGVHATWPLPAAEHPPHYLLCVLEHGAAWLRDAEGLQVMISAPAVLLLGEAARPAVARAVDLRGRCITFDPCVINDALQLEGLRQVPHGLSGTAKQDFFLVEPFARQTTRPCALALPPESARRLHESLDRLQTVLQRQDTPLWPCRARSYLIEALFMLRLLRDELETTSAADTQPLAPAAPERGDLSAALLILNCRYAEDWTLERLSRQCCSNRTSLNAYIRQRTGMTMRSYLSSLRMTMAANLLRDTELPVSEILSRVGYDSASHFSRAFRAHHGVSPADYRRATA
jgi:AraC family L-rhamnose operon regulatory protein RhaS